MAADAEAGGVRQEFRVARNLVEATLLKLKEMPRFKVDSVFVVRHVSVVPHVNFHRFFVARNPEF